MTFPWLPNVEGTARPLLWPSVVGADLLPPVLHPQEDHLCAFQPAAFSPSVPTRSTFQRQRVFGAPGSMGSVRETCCSWADGRCRVFQSWSASK